MTHILALSNQKGGVAKTTTCMSLGGALVELGKKVLVVDLDSQANLTLAAGLDADELPWTIVDLFEAISVDMPEAWVGAIYTTGMTGLDVLPADLRLASVERALYDEANYEQILTQILQKLNVNYDYILLDCPPSLGAITLMALTTAAMVLVPVQCEYYAARGLSRLLDTVSEVKKRTNPISVRACLVSGSTIRGSRSTSFSPTGSTPRTRCSSSCSTTPRSWRWPGPSVPGGCATGWTIFGRGAAPASTTP